MGLKNNVDYLLICKYNLFGIMEKIEYIFRTLLVILICSVFWGCSKDKTIKSSEGLSLPHVESFTYELVGQLHNECVEYVLQELSCKAPLTRSTAVVDSWDDISLLTKQFLENKGYEVNYKVLSTRSSTSFVDCMDLQFDFSDVQNKYLNKLKYSVEKSESIDDFVEDIDKVEKEMMEDSYITELEREPLLYGLSVLRYSAAYWSENYDKWSCELFGIQSFATTKGTQEAAVSQSWWERNKDIVVADGWWLWQGMVQGAPSGIPAFMIIMGIAEGAGASVIAALGR